MPIAICVAVALWLVELTIHITVACEDLYTFTLNAKIVLFIIESCVRTLRTKASLQKRILQRQTDKVSCLYKIKAKLFQENYERGDLRV